MKLDDFFSAFFVLSKIYLWVVCVPIDGQERRGTKPGQIEFPSSCK